jgi:hypothetical protein
MRGQAQLDRNANNATGPPRLALDGDDLVNVQLVTVSDRLARTEPLRQMLTKDILFGMNILTLVGLIMTGFGLTLRRMGRPGLPLCFAVMGVGTALVLAGLYAGGWPH